MEPTKLQNVIGKIHKLRALSESTHSRGEKEACAGAISRLITEYAISEAEILAHSPGEASSDPIDLESEHIIYETGKISNWKSTLAIGIARLNGLFLYNAVVRNEKTHRKMTRYRIIGRNSDVEFALYCFGYLTSEILQLADATITVGQFVVNDDGQLVGKRGVNPQKESFCLGCVRGFLDKMNAEKAEAMKQATSTALVFIGNKAKEAEAAFKTKTGIVLARSSYKSKAQLDAENYHSGYRAGQKLSVNPGLGSGNRDEPKKFGK